MDNTPYEGCGVGVADFNNDGLQDVFFVGDSVFALYKNLGNLKFQNVIATSGIRIETGAHTISIADINNDGLPDIVIGFSNAFHWEDTTHIRIYFNTGNFTFQEQNHRFKINSRLPQISRINLVDVNHDGHLDFIIHHWNGDDVSSYGALLNNTKGKDEPTENLYYDKLFVFENGKYIDKTREYNFRVKTPVHTAFNSLATDINADGWTDIVVANDFDTPDLIYINKEGKKFEEQREKFFKVTSFYSMGSDVADINNDGLLDFVTCDMRPVGNFRSKTIRYETSYTWQHLYHDKVNFIADQSVRNTLQLNNGNGTFSEIGQYAGIDATEWSWSPLLADFDNDGFKDLFISNGVWHDRAYQYDFIHLMDSFRNLPEPVNFYEMFQHDTLIPEHFKNYIFKNNGDFTFSNKQTEWGFEKPIDSRGAAYADFDNDGDLDIVVNNSNGISFIYRNNSEKINPQNFLRVALKHENNLPVFHSTVTIFYDNGKMQFSEMNPIRGFYSTSEAMLHFGLGTTQKVDSLIVRWNDGKIQKINAPEINKTIMLLHQNALTESNVKKPITKTIFEPSALINFKHQQDDWTDFLINPLLPNQYSQLGPAIACGDLNGNGKDDFITGGSQNELAYIFFAEDSGGFRKENFLSEEKKYNDMGILLFDIDNDGDLDLYMASGGYRFPEGHQNLKHRLYLNDGNGNFSAADNLPAIFASASSVTACDFDKDGFTDLFVGGRVTSHEYPLPPKSYLLKNMGGKLVDVTDDVVPELRNIGMVTASLWTDFDDDGWFDLIVVGEYMQPEFFRNNGKGNLERVTDKLSFGQSLKGFWNSITGVDIDNDGDTDYILGNLGENTRWKATPTQPLEIFAADFDANGSLDIIATYRENGKRYPTKPLDVYKTRISGLAKIYYKYAMFGNATIEDMFGKEKVEKAFRLEAHETASGILLNEGNGKFTFKKFPAQAQWSPVFGLHADDFDGDGFADVLLTGNFHHPEIERGKYTALNGLFLKGNGLGDFLVLNSSESGFLVKGDARALSLFRLGKEILVLASQNSDSLKCFTYHPPSYGFEMIPFPKGKNIAFVRLPIGASRKYERYLGSGYLSQSGGFILKKESESVDFQ